MSAGSSLRAAVAAFWDSFLPNNIVLVQAAGLCPILAVGYNLKYGVALSICTAATLLPVGVCLTLLRDRVATWLRPALYAVLASLLLFVCALVMDRSGFAHIYAKLHVFLPLLAVNMLFTYRTDGGRHSQRIATAIGDTLGAALGFALVMCIACTLREMAMTGTIWDIPLGYEVRFPEAEHPFIGFVLLGFMAATLQWFKQLSRRLRSGKEADEL